MCSLCCISYSTFIVSDSSSRSPRHACAVTHSAITFTFLFSPFPPHFASLSPYTSALLRFYLVRTNTSHTSTPTSPCEAPVRLPLHLGYRHSSPPHFASLSPNTSALLRVYLVQTATSHTFTPTSFFCSYGQATVVATPTSLFLVA